MKRIYVNFKRFDVPTQIGGVNSLAPTAEWADTILAAVSENLRQYDAVEAEFTMFFPEAHLLRAVLATQPEGLIKIGCQGVYREDIVPGANFGAFTTNRPAAAAQAIGCQAAIIGHCEERADYAGILTAAGCADTAPINGILNREMICACGRGLQVLYCIGETAEQREEWEHVLSFQLEEGLRDIPCNQVVIAYEPVWAIGPGKTPPNRETIRQRAQLIKKVTGGLPVVYGGGLKEDNAQMLASIPEIDGGLIALTRFVGEIGFYPEEYLEIVRRYLGKLGKETRYATAI